MTSSAPSFGLDYPSESPAARRAPRLWPGVVIVMALWPLIKIPAWLATGTILHFMTMVWGPVLGVVATIIWWLGFSRLPWKTRWTGLIAFIAFLAIAIPLSHPTMKMVYLVLGAPVAVTAWVAWSLIGARLDQRRMRLGLIAAIAMAWGFFTLFRMDGVDGSIHITLTWRWSQTAEERYLASLKDKAMTAPTTATAALELASGDWPAYRGPMRDGRLAGFALQTDWAKHPPKLLWKHLIGPGWSSFCVVGDLAITQEQRGEVEVVAAYRLATGDEVWAHGDNVRFNEAMAGPGPRATPTFDAGKIYAMGATGRLNCLEAQSGKLIWSRDVKAESGAALPPWGFSSSPLIAGANVAVLTGAKGKSIMAYNAATGLPAWASGDGWSYCSPQLSKIDGVEQIVYVSESGAVGLEPVTGRVLWQHEFKLGGAANRVTQPTIINDTDLLFGAAFGIGTRRIHITRSGPDWTTKEIWTSRSIKPYYNDVVIHKGHLYGFDGSTFTCIDLETGKSKWRSSKGYGNGQVLLLPDQDVLLILSEHGEVALVEARPEEYREIASFQAIEGKTWNHPVIAHGKLLVRNGEEAGCYQLDGK